MSQCSLQRVPALQDIVDILHRNASDIVCSADRGDDIDADPDVAITSCNFTSIAVPGSDHGCCTGETADDVIEMIHGHF